MAKTCEFFILNSSMEYVIGPPLEIAAPLCALPFYELLCPPLSHPNLKTVPMPMTDSFTGKMFFFSRNGPLPVTSLEARPDTVWCLPRMA